VGQGAKVWAPQVLGQGRKQQRALGSQRNFDPDESSWDRPGGVSEEDWASPTPEKKIYK